MEYQSILDLEESSYKNRVRPAFYLDLNIDQLIEQIQYQWGLDISPYFYYFPENEACERYRREIYQDVKKESVRGALAEFTDQMRNYQEACSNKVEVQLDLQKDVWHLWEVYDYCLAFKTLHRALAAQELESQGMRAFVEYLGTYLASEDFVLMKEQADALIEELTGVNLVLTMENDHITITNEKLPGSYEKFLDQCFPGHKKNFRSPFAGTLHLSDLEIELIQAYKKKNPAFFTKASRFYAEYIQYSDAVLLRFYQEIGFYLAFYCFEEKMRAQGCAFAVPTVDRHRELSACGLYDLALACANCRQNKQVVSNDMAYREGERFFVVTGPNQGGKTTFARSLGQLIYFAKMGLDVPAVSANVHYFSDILTHFSVEESIESGRGKLKEELDRLAPMMSAVFENAFVIINELFTTAANYDACIMGKRVLEHFLKQRCQGVYVTHLKELSEINEQIVSLRALVEEVEEQVEEDDGIRTRVRNVRRFKMIRSTAEDTGYASDLVEKYRLTYEQLMMRLQERGND